MVFSYLPARLIRSGFTAILSLSIVLALISCKPKIDRRDPPFTLDSLLTFTYDSLVKMTGKENLREESSGVTLLMPGTGMEVEIRWEDNNNRSYMKSVTVRADSGRMNVWKTRDSIRAGMAMKEVEQINKEPFYFNHDGEAVGWGFTGELSHHISYGRFDFKREKNPADPNFSSNGEVAIQSNPRLVELTIERKILAPPFKIEKITFTTSDGRIVDIPRAAHRKGEANAIIDEINKDILARYSGKSFDEIQKNIKAAGSFEWEIDNELLAIHFTSPDEIVYYSIGSGRRWDAESPELPVYALFDYEKFFPFIEKYWLPGCASSLSSADTKCLADAECNCYNISANVKEDKMILSLKTTDCGKGCLAAYSISMPLDTMKHYFNDYGNKLLSEERFYSQKPLQKYRAINRARVAGPHYLFVKVKLDNLAGMDDMGSYEIGPTSVALTIDSGKVKGYFNTEEIPGVMIPEVYGQVTGRQSVTGKLTKEGFTLYTYNDNTGETEQWLRFSWFDNETGKTYGRSARLTAFTESSPVKILFYAESGKDNFLNTFAEEERSLPH